MPPQRRVSRSASILPDRVAFFQRGTRPSLPKKREFAEEDSSLGIARSRYFISFRSFIAID